MKTLIGKLAYCAMWVLISVVSSFNCVLKWDWSFLCYQPADMDQFMTRNIFPFLVWTVAFFIDYLYQLLSSGWINQSALQRRWWVIVIGCVIVQFIAIGMGIYYFDNTIVRFIIFGLFIAIFLFLKSASLFGMEDASHTDVIHVKSC